MKGGYVEMEDNNMPGMEVSNAEMTGNNAPGMEGNGEELLSPA